MGPVCQLQQNDIQDTIAEYRPKNERKTERENNDQQGGDDPQHLDGEQGHGQSKDECTCPDVPVDGK